MKISNLFNFTSTLPDLAESYKELDELATKIELVSGYSLKELLELFKAGYTLEAPEYKSLEEVFNGKTE